MDFIEQIRIRPKGALTGLCAEINCPAPVLQPWKVYLVSISENAPA